MTTDWIDGKKNIADKVSKMQRDPIGVINSNLYRNCEGIYNDIESYKENFTFLRATDGKLEYFDIRDNLKPRLNPENSSDLQKPTNKNDDKEASGDVDQTSWNTFLKVKRRSIAAITRRMKRISLKHDDIKKSGSKPNKHTKTIF